MTHFTPHPGDRLVTVEATFVLTLTELCRAGSTDEAQVRSLIDEGVLNPAGESPADWHFDAQALRTVRIAKRLARDFELSFSGTALVLELMAQIESLQARLRSSEPR